MLHRLRGKLPRSGAIRISLFLLLSGLSLSAWGDSQSAQQAYLKASNTGAGDNFGHSVAISGLTAVVGATLEASAATGVNHDQADNSAGNSGAAYAFLLDIGYRLFLPLIQK